MTLLIRPPRLSDVGRLAVVNVDTWRDAYAGIVVEKRLDQMELHEYRARWRLNVTELAHNTVCLVAELDGVVQAYAVGGPYRPQDEWDEPTGAATRLGEVYALYAHPEVQGRGVGRAVHDALLAGLATSGYLEAALWVLRDNTRGRAWYQRQGWHLDGATADWVAHGITHPEVRMRRLTHQPYSSA